MTVVERLGLIRDGVLDWWRSAAVVQRRREVRHLIVDLAIPTTRRLFVEGALPRSRLAFAIAGARGGQMLEQRAPRIAASLRRIPPRLRVTVVAALVVAIVIGAVVAFSRPAPEITAATAFLDGEYVAPPFAVKADNGDITVNGVRVRPRPSTTPPALVPPSDPKDADGLATVAAARIAKPGTTTEEVDAVVAQLRALPATASVEKQEDAIVITDRSGATMRVLYGVRESATEERVLTSQRSLAASWQRLLDDGGVLLTADGVDVEVPPEEAPSFLSAVDDVFAMPEGARASALARITGSIDVAEAVLRAGSPAKLRERIGLWPGPLRVQAAARYGLMAPAASPGHVDAETPRSRMAYLFDYFHYDPELDLVRETVRRMGYTLVQYQGGEWSGKRFARAFAYIGLTGGAGLIYVSTHGERDGILFEGFSDRAETEARMKEYLAVGLFSPGELQVTRGSGHYLKVTKAGISRLFKDQNTIVQLSICYGWFLKDAFRAREFIGPSRPTKGIEAEVINGGLYPRLDGTKDGGEQRLFANAAARALDDYTKAKRSDFQLDAPYFYEGKGNTVLAPAVTDVAPASAIAPKKQVAGRVHFEVPMDMQVPATSILDVSGCESRILAGSLRWQDPQTLSFTVETKSEGTLIFTVIAAAALSAGGEIALDGNTSPKKDHVGPAGDDYTWNVPCEPGALGQRPDGQQTRLGQFSASTEKARVGDKVTLTVAVSSGDQWLCGGEFHTPGGVRFVTIGGVPGAKLLDWSPRQLSRPGARVEGPPQSGAITWRAGEANPEPPNCRELSAQGGAPTGLFKTGDVFTATYEVIAPTSDWVLLRASIQNEQGTGGAAVAFAATGQASPTPTLTTAPTPSRPATTPPSDPSVLVRSCSPSTVTPERARALVGRDVTLCFPVWKVETTGVGSVILWSSDSPPRVAAIIPKSATTRFAERFGPASGLRGLLIETSGRLLLHDDVPQVVLLSSNQLSLPLADR